MGHRWQQMVNQTINRRSTFICRRKPQICRCGLSTEAVAEAAAVLTGHGGRGSGGFDGDHGLQGKTKGFMFSWNLAVLRAEEEQLVFAVGYGVEEDYGHGGRVVRGEGVA